MSTSANVNRSHDQRSVSQRIRDIFESIMQLPSEESHLRFLEKRMEDVANEFKATLVSSSLGLDHPTAPFRQVEDGFGHTLQRQKDFLERMVTRKRSYTSSSSAYFPPPTHGTKRRQTFDDDLDRATKRDNERNPNT